MKASSILKNIATGGLRIIYRQIRKKHIREQKLIRALRKDKRHKIVSRLRKLQVVAGSSPQYASHLYHKIGMGAQELKNVLNAYRRYPGLGQALYSYAESQLNAGRASAQSTSCEIRRGGGRSDEALPPPRRLFGLRRHGADGPKLFHAATPD